MRLREKTNQNGSNKIYKLRNSTWSTNKNASCHGYCSTLTREEKNTTILLPLLFVVNIKSKHMNKYTNERKEYKATTTKIKTAQTKARDFCCFRKTLKCILKWRRQNCYFHILLNRSKATGKLKWLVNEQWQKMCVSRLSVDTDDGWSRYYLLKWIKFSFVSSIQLS